MGTLIIRILTFLLIMTCSCSSLYGASIQNKFISVDVNDSGSMLVVDKRTKMVWKSDPLPMKKVSVESGGINSIVINLFGKFEFKVVLTIESDKPDLMIDIMSADPDIIIEETKVKQRASRSNRQRTLRDNKQRTLRDNKQRTLRGNKQRTLRGNKQRTPRDNSWREHMVTPQPVLLFPYPFYPENNEVINSTEILFNFHEGIRIPMNDTILHRINRTFSNWYQPDAAYKQMRWIGMISNSGGYSLEIITPYDGGFYLKALNGDMAYAPGVKWYSEKSKFKTTRKVKFSFSPTNNLMDLVKQYSSDEKPTINGLEKIYGAANIWLWGAARKPEFLKKIYNSGIKKAILSVDLHSPPMIDNDWIDTGKRLGYIMSNYTNYSNVYRKLGETSESAILLKDGKPARGPRGGWLSCYKTRLKKNIKLWEGWDLPFTGSFLDTLAAGPLRECYSNIHPSTRKEDMANKRNFMTNLLNNGLILGSENVSSWAIGYAHYFEGVMSMELFKDRNMRARRTVSKKENPQSQAIFLTTREKPGKEYLKYGLNESVMVPLFELVNHQYAISTWHWRDDNRKINGMWWKKNLFNILYGTMPLFNITDETWKDDKNKYVRTYETVCNWHARVAGKPMTMFTYLTKDRKIQETRFGKESFAIVNFTDKTYRDERYSINVPSYGYYISDKDWSEKNDMTSLLGQ